MSDGPIDDGFSYNFIFNQPYTPFNFDPSEEYTKLDLIVLVQPLTKLLLL